MSPWAQFLLVGLADALFLSTEVFTRREALVIQNQSAGCLVELSTVHYQCHEGETDEAEDPVKLQFGLDCREMQHNTQLDVTDGQQQCARLELATNGSKAALPSPRSFRLERGDFANLRCSIFPLKLLWSPDDKHFHFDLTMDFALRSGLPSIASEISQISLVQLLLTSSVKVGEARKEDCKRRLERLYEWKVEYADQTPKLNVMTIFWRSSQWELDKNVLKYQVMAKRFERQEVSPVTFADLQPKVIMADVDGHTDVKEHVTLTADSNWRVADGVRGHLHIDDAQLPPGSSSCEVTLGYSYPGGDTERTVIVFDLHAMTKASERKFFIQVSCIVALLLPMVGLFYWTCCRSPPPAPTLRAAPSQSSQNSMNIELS